MRKSVVIICIATLTWSVRAATITSHTFFSVRPYFQSEMPEHTSLFRNDLLDECQGFGGAVEVVAFGGTTTCMGSAKLARFFLPPGCHGSCLRVKEFNPTLEENPANTDDGNPLKDLEARHFNIRTVDETFASTICIKPHQQVFGVGLVYKQTISHKCDGTTGFWFEIDLPLQQVTNKVCVEECIENDGGGPRDELGLDNAPRVGTMREAFRQETWRGGRITNRSHSKFGVADMEFKIGYNSFSCDVCTSTTYVGMVFPTGNKVRACELFEPIVGNNHHVGFMLGSSLCFYIWSKWDFGIMLYFDNNTRYLFSNVQERSLDLIGKPWSRYMEMYNSTEQAFAAFSANDQNSGTSGINVLTQCVRVSPRVSSNSNTGFLFTKQSHCATWLLELGYNFFARQGEVVELECPSAISRAALKSVNGQGQTTLARTVRNNYPASFFTLAQRYAAITNCDVDLESAAHPTTISNTLYATLGYRWERDCPMLLAVGGSYEFTTEEITTTFDRWIVWGKFGVTF